MSKCFVIITSCFIISFAEPPDTLWTRTIGGTEEDFGQAVQQTTDGGYIVTGYTRSYGNGDWDVYLVKTDSIGDTLWTRTFGGNLEDGGKSVQQTTDGGYIVTGWTYSFGQPGYSNIYLIKTDAMGDTLWMKTYGRATSDEYGQSVAQTTDGGYIVGGTGGSGIYLVKTDSLGDTLWIKEYLGNCYSIQPTLDGGYILAGMEYMDYWDFLIIKTDSIGDTLWTKIYGGSGEDRAFCIRQTTDSGFVVVGRSDSFNPPYFDAYVIKTDEFGDTMWTKTFGGPSNDWAISVYQTSDQGYIYTGYTASFGPGSVWLVRLDEQGDTLWTDTYGSVIQDGGFSVQQTTDGGYIIAGQKYQVATNYDFYLVKTGPDMTGFNEQQTTIRKTDYHFATIITGPLLLPEDKTCKVFDITGRETKPYLLQPGIYFIEIEGKIIRKVVKLR